MERVPGRGAAGEKRVPVEKFWRINAPDVISETIDGETIILHLGNGFYFAAGGAGTLAWSMLSQSATVERTALALAQAYEAEGVDLPAAVEAFAAELVAEGLLVDGDAPGDPELPQDGAREPWQEPTLSKFTDMEDLLLLDPVHEVSPTQGWPYAAAPDRAGK